MNKALRVAPSILSADLSQLANEIRETELGGADWVHVDVMDGQFVPNITLGVPVVAAVNRCTQLPIDVHLMLREPSHYVEAFADAGADIITIHIEACTHPQRTLSRIQQLGKRAGIALNPQTHENDIKYILDDVDMVLVMSVNPGFSGQRFIPSVLQKIRAIRTMVEASGRAIDIEVDGGIEPATVRAVTEAGATILVAGSSVYGQPDRRAAIAEIRAAAR